ncbi:hypothetical protein [Rhodonellum sp.]|uniref:hypothetical protein n=1 Tax=Rhodonellum sp. TaxID=2231180 RepID=UPI00271FBF8C|nr:hypothetical protein [Rhodonellum sp.]MDO9553299.1 hypothetical protein [Rhodonellum sp.]
MEFLKIEKESESEFANIAQTLFDSYAIQTNKAIYRLIEIEFYWNSPNHIDNSTYKRKHVDPKAGDWLFHYSGVDIALKNEETGGYGGILIRGIFEINRKTMIKGPMVCAMKLFSENNAFSQSIKTQIINHSFPKSEMIKKPRFGLGQNAKESGADQLNYAFVINPSIE